MTSAKNRALRASGWKPPRKTTLWPREWMPEEVEMLRAMAGRHSASQIAVAMNERFGTDRKPAHVLSATHRRKISLAPTMLKMKDVARICGVSRAVAGEWATDGLLETEQWPAISETYYSVRGYSRPGRYHHKISDEAFERFIREYAHLLVPALMEPGKWRSLAEVYGRRQRNLLTTKQVGLYLGLAKTTVRGYMRRGIIPFIKLPGLPHLLFVDPAVLPAVKTRIEEMRAAALVMRRAHCNRLSASMKKVVALPADNEVDCAA